MMLAFCTVYFSGKIHGNYLLTLSMGIVLLMTISLLIYFTVVMRIERMFTLKQSTLSVHNIWNFKIVFAFPPIFF
jgi:hypothetical protein